MMRRFIDRWYWKTTIAVSKEVAEKLKDLKWKYRFYNLNQVITLLLLIHDKVSEEERERLADQIRFSERAEREKSMRKF